MAAIPPLVVPKSHVQVTRVCEVSTSITQQLASATLRPWFSQRVTEIVCVED